MSTVMSRGERSGRVALVHDWLTGMRGGEKVLEALVDLFPQAPIFTLFHFPGTTSERIEAQTIHTSFLQHLPLLRRHYRSYLPLFPTAIETFDLDGFDLVLSSSHCVAKGIVPAPGAVHVCYCHTPMRYAWDQEKEYFPKRHGVMARLRGLVLSALRAWDVSTGPRVDAFFVNSHFVAQRVRRYYGREAEVIPPPVDVDFFTPSDSSASTSDGIGDSRNEYCLCFAALAPYKRVDLAIAACRHLGIELRLVGGDDRQRSRQSAPPVQRLGRIDAEELRCQYRGALCVLQPGIEDFGITAAEALACGTPVVAAGRGGVLDIIEPDTQGVLYPPDAGVDGLIAAIDKCRRLGFNKLNLRRKAESFSADRFADRIREGLGRYTVEGRAPRN